MRARKPESYAPCKGNEGGADHGQGYYVPERQFSTARENSCPGLRGHYEEAEHMAVKHQGGCDYIANPVSTPVVLYRPPEI